MDFVVNNLLPSIGETVNHHRNVDENMKKFKRKCEELNCKREDVESKIKTELHPRKMLKKEVDCWLTNVRRINDEKQAIESEVQRGKYLDRSRLGKLIVEKLQEVEELFQKGSFCDGLVLDAPSCKGIVFPSTTLVGGTTAKRKMEEVWEHLMSNDSPYIGLYGMGGSGKTTIMKLIHNRILNEDKFINVIWITMSKATNVIRFQNDIAAALTLDIPKHEDEATRAAWLYNILKEQRLLLILDDMWEAFDLQEVGIPKPTVENGCKLILTTRLLDVCRRMNCKCIKMELLTEDEAWNLFVNKVGLDLFMNSDLEAIAKDVAKECACLPLAIITIGRSMNNVVDQSEWRNVLRELKRSRKGFSEMEKVIERVKLSYTRLKDEKLQRCLLYCALYPEDFKIQRDEVIMYLIAEEIVEGMTSWQEKCDEGNTILNKLEYACVLESTDFMDKKFVKMHDIIRDMALQVMGQGSMVKACEKLRDFQAMEEWKEDLETVSLMHNVVEYICPKASPMCSRLKTLLLARNKGLTKIPDSFFVHMPSLRLLGISQEEIQLLPHCISGLEHLTELRLEGCTDLKYVPTLAKLQGLRVLKLGWTSIEELPQGLEMLVNLQYLDIFGCKNLKCQSGILSKLIRLQCLIIYFRSENPKIVEEIARLRKIETLMVYFSYLNDFNTYVRSIRLQQRRLPNSCYLKVGLLFPPAWRRIWALPRASQRRKFIEMYPGAADMGGSSNLRLLPNDDIDKFYIGANVKLSSLCDLLIREGGGLPSSWPPPPPPPLQPMSNFFCLRKLEIECNGHIKKLFTPQLMPMFKNLEEICVKFCCNLKEIFSAAEGDNDSSNNDALLITITFPKLRSLSLTDVPELKSITSRKWIMVCNSIQLIKVMRCPKLKRLPLSLPGHDGLPCSFSSLRKLEIGGNDHIKKLFNPKLMPQFQNLEEICVDDCYNLREIFSATEGDDKEEEMNEGNSNNVSLLFSIALPKLRVLELKRLPELKSITSRRGIMVCNSIQLIKIINCRRLKRLPLSLPMHNGLPSPPPSLTEIFTNSRRWWDSLEWDNPIDKDVLQSFLQFNER